MIKEILCLAHSHYDNGYTHPQNMLNELQADYIDDAIDLCLATEDYPEETKFRWTCEAVYPVLNWWKTASDERKALLRRLISERRISVCAFPFHFTPNANARQIAGWLSKLDELRELTGAEIAASISHDVNGVPWSVPELLIDAGVKMMIAGPNLDHGGIPFERPYLFNWKTQSGRKIPFLLGEHYSFVNTCLGCRSPEQLHEGALKYLRRFEEGHRNWRKDFVYLTATNPNLVDNGGPDLRVPELFRRYNEAGYEPKIRFVTPELLYDRIAANGTDSLPEEAGDWTDYWNFGTASTAMATKQNRRAKVLLNQSDFLRSLYPERMPAKLEGISEEAYKNSMLFDEHTWGCFASISNPDWENSRAQLMHKESYALTAAELAAYLAGPAFERYARNPAQTDIEREFVLVNPTDQRLTVRAALPGGYRPEGLAASACRVREKLTYDGPGVGGGDEIGYISLKPFEVQHIPFAELSGAADAEKRIVMTDAGFVTPHYEVTLDPESKEIRQIRARDTGLNLLNEKSAWKFFDVVEETVDPAFAEPNRGAAFPGGDVMYGSVSGWNHDWKALRRGCEAAAPAEIVESLGDLVLICHSRTEHLEDVVRQIRFSSAKPGIELSLSFRKREERAPLGIYTVFPLALNEGWRAAFDTADTVVPYDEGQLGASCRDYVTVDRAAAVYDDRRCVILACPDAPMVQIGDFRFGHETRRVPRDADPLLLGWPMNNYWQTNFPVSENGWQKFRWELSALSAYSPEVLRAAGIQAETPCLTGRAVEAVGDGGELLSLESPHTSLLCMIPAKDGGGFVTALRNFSDSTDSCAVTFRHRAVADVKRITLTGKMIGDVKTEDNRFTAVLGAYETQVFEIRY